MTLKQFFKKLYPKTNNLAISDIHVDTDLVLFLRSRKKRGVCPYCGQASRRFHSRYTRSIRDLPCVATPVNVNLIVRRFRCTNETCAKQTFAERFEGLVSPYARYTDRLAKVIEQVGINVGAEPGAKLLESFALKISPDKLLSQVHRLSIKERECPSKVGIDDFAFRKGISYGTIIVDLDKGKPVDLLPSRDAELVIDWLEQHPQIEIVSRDRAKEYAFAISKGAPQATQVMDRWHVLKNLREAVEKEISRRYSEIKAVFELKGLLGQPIPRSKREREAQALVIKKQQKQYQQVHALNEQGVTIVQISKQLGLSRNSIYTYLRSPEVPTAKRNKRQKSPLDRFRPQLETRYREGRMSITEVWQDLKTLGYSGSYQPVRRWFFERRQMPTKLIGLRISPRHFASLFIKDLEKLSEKETLIITTLDTMPELKQLRAEAVRFRDALLNQKPLAMKDWLDDITDSVFISLRNFAIGLDREWDALEAACASHYSNGPTEGAVNKLKLIKRQMYGRASFNLLRKRVLLA